MTKQELINAIENFADDIDVIIETPNGDRFTVDFVTKSTKYHYNSMGAMMPKETTPIIMHVVEEEE